MPGPHGIIVENDPNENLLKVLFAIHRQASIQSKMMRNYANPVDEYEYNQSAIDITTLQGNAINIQPAFSSEVRIESIIASLPVGITAASLQLGKRFIPMYAGPITTVQTIFKIEHTGIIINGSDDRFLSWTGTATSGYYIGLSGHTAERERN